MQATARRLSVVLAMSCARRCLIFGVQTLPRIRDPSEPSILHCKFFVFITPPLGHLKLGEPMFELPIIVVGLRFGDAAIDFVVCCWCIHASLNHLRQRTGGSRCQCFRLSCAAGPLRTVVRPTSNTTTMTTHDTIIAAIQEQRILELTYDGIHRQVEPHAYGRASTGNNLLRCFQISGGHTSDKPHDWNLMNVAKISGLVSSEQRFSRCRNRQRGRLPRWFWPRR